MLESDSHETIRLKNKKKPKWNLSLFPLVSAVSLILAAAPCCASLT